MAQKRNIIVGQSGGPTAVINSSLAGVYKTARERGFHKVYGMLHGVQGLLDEQYVDLSTQIHSDMDIELLKRTPSAFLGSCRYKLPEIHEDERIYERIFEVLDKLEIDAFIYIGGNDSMDTIKKLSDYAIIKGHKQKFLGVPKTIDNDLALTDHTPGFGSAAKYIATSTKEVIRDATGMTYNDKEAITIIEIMGRNAGWLTGAAALARTEECEGPDLIYLPEVVFDMDKFVARVRELLTKKESVVIAVSEGVQIADGRFVCELGREVAVDAFGHKQMSGTAVILAQKVAEETGLKTRAIEFSTLQRAATHIASLTDINEAFQVGHDAVVAANEGKTGMMITLDRNGDDPYQCGTSAYDIHAIANVERKVPDEWITADGTDLTDDFEKYGRPLIMGELMPLYVNGTPRHLVRK